MQRIGVLLPPANVTCEREFPAAVPPGYSVHFTRLVRAETHVSASSLVKMQGSAALPGLPAAGARGFGVVTPYPMDITGSTTAFLEAHGMRVAAVDTYNCQLS